MKRFKVKTTRAASFIIAIMITCISNMSTTFAEENFLIEKDYSDMITSKGGITDELYEIIEHSNACDLIPVDIWITPCDINEIENQVKHEIGYNKSDIIDPYNNSNFFIMQEHEYTSDQVDMYIETERRLYAYYQNSIEQEFINNCIQIKNLQIAYNSDNIFISQYAPLIHVSLTKDEIIQIEKNDMVEEIYYSPIMEFINDTNISIPLIHGDYTRDTQGLTGSGIKIGQLELCEPNSSKPYFTSSNIFYDTSKPRNYDTSDSHANKVAAVMIGIPTNVYSYKGIVPDAKLYSAYLGAYSDWRLGVEWLLTQGVNVINMSATLGGTAGVYGTHEKWVDHIAINHSVHFVKSAGNSGEEVTSPGLAYNIITVGGINDQSTANQSDDTLDPDSSYIEASGLTNKPDLSAPSEWITTAAGTDSGTSFAAPHVTAVIAQLCQKKPALKVLQDSVKSIITAGIKHSILSFDSSSGFDFNKAGAGCVDAQGSYYVINNNRYIHSSFAANTSNGTTRNYTFNVTSSDEIIRVSLSWLKYSTISGTHSSSTPTLGTLGDLDLRVYDKNGNLVKAATSSNNNTEIVQFTPNPALNPYKIEVKQYTNSDRTIYYTVSWY